MIISTFSSIINLLELLVSFYNFWELYFSFQYSCLIFSNILFILSSMYLLIKSSLRPQFCLQALFRITSNMDKQFTIFFSLFPYFEEDEVEFLSEDFANVNFRILEQNKIKSLTLLRIIDRLNNIDLLEIKFYPYQLISVFGNPFVSIFCLNFLIYF